MIYQEYTDELRAVWSDDTLTREQKRDREASITAAFKEALEEEYGTDEYTPEQKHALYNKAYADGHSSGYSEIEGVYLELASLVEYFTTP